MKHTLKSTLPVGKLLICFAVLALALVTTSAAASTNGGIVIRGLEKSSSQLELTMSGEELIVEGRFEPGEQAGCEFTDGHNALRCPLAGIGQIEVTTGSGNDTVEVLDPLPVPLTAHLGDGSDEFTGNDELDTCYAGAGQDNCSGGSGNDRLYGGSDPDRLYGDNGDDRIYGGSGPDRLYGGIGNDRLYGGSGSDNLYGTSGKDFCKGAPGVGRSFCETGPGD